MRRHGSPPKPGQGYINRLGAYAIVLDPVRDQILLTEQAMPEPEVQLPGGGVDPGENPVAALHREVLEETGWRIGPPRHLTTYQRYTYMPDYGIHARKICMIFIARPGPRLGPPREAGHRALWAPPGAVAVASPGDRAVLAAWLAAGRPARLRA